MHTLLDLSGTFAVIFLSGIGLLAMKKHAPYLLGSLILLILLSGCAIVPTTGTGIATPTVAKSTVPSCQNTACHTPVHTLIDTSPDVHLFQSFDYHIQDPATIAPYYDFVWGASPQKFAAFRTGNPKIRLSYYISFFRDSGVFPNVTARHTLSSWKATHPDWILYQCDRTTPAYEDGQNDIIPLNFSQPDVIAWQVQNYALPASQYGYDAIAADNFNMENLVGACGSYKNGQWVQRYSGGTNDPQWRADILAWATQMQTALHALPHPLALIPNVGYGGVALSSPYVGQLVTHLDGVLDEGGFTKYGHGYVTDADWLTTVHLIEAVQQQHKPYYLVNELATLDHATLQWALASYLLANEQSEFLSITGIQQYGADLRYPEYTAQIGSPSDEIYQDKNLYWRDYTHALIVVNPSSTQSYSAKLPGRYSDLYDNSVAQTITLPPHSGMVLLF